MKETPTDSEVRIFQRFVKRALSIQGQLDAGYKVYRYLRDRLSEAIDIPAIKGFIKDRPARYSQQLGNRVATQLYDRSRTAGAEL